MKPCIAIFGPTASGKSSLAIKLAKKYNGVIISADSMQIYKEMDIGTAKPTKEEMAEVPHKMIGFLDPSQRFSVYDYKIKAKEEMAGALKEGKLPILVGGTGLYFDALFFNTEFGEFETPKEIRDHLNQRIENGESAQLLEELKRVDPDAALKLSEKDTKRIVRALEVFLSTGKTITEMNALSHQKKSEFNFLKVFLNFSNRQNLYDRINLRVDEMISLGLVEETKDLLKKGYLGETTAAQAIGYKELLPYLAGEKDLELCIETLKQKTRNYAKRQLTWFRRYQDAVELFMDSTQDQYLILQEHINDFLKEW